VHPVITNATLKIPQYFFTRFLHGNIVMFTLIHSSQRHCANLMIHGLQGALQDVCQARRTAVRRPENQAIAPL
jgi:hypothetical protein